MHSVSILHCSILLSLWCQTFTTNVEDEIQTLRQVLLSKFRRQQFLKRQLGITPIEELKSEVKQGLDTLRTSDAYLKTSAVVKTTSAALFEKWNLLRYVYQQIYLLMFISFNMYIKILCRHSHQVERKFYYLFYLNT
ncbi:unnamed protein product [Schistosoma mattheei]|uniref:Uncharacterized protein n=1 Tax=Schistosoma mattheei TaxID=31246 RepID=A0A3P8BJ60_9TREM|nr:unnamed protein product [Schistosoma mattheei]